MVAPQYRGDEALSVTVSAGRIEGDLQEIDILNQYVGVVLPLDGPETRLLPWALGLLAVLAFLTAGAPRRLLPRAAAALLLLGLAVSGCAAAVLQYRLYQMGHERADEVMEGVENFTPPILGHVQVANFDAWMSLGAGGWSLLGALVMTACFLFGSRRRGAAAGSAP